MLGIGQIFNSVTRLGQSKKVAMNKVWRKWECKSYLDLEKSLKEKDKWIDSNTGAYLEGTWNTKTAEVA